MGTTPLDRLPYPEPTDQIRLMAQHIKDLATKLDPDPTWIGLPLASGWSAWTAEYAPRYRKFGSVVMLQGLIRPTSAPGADALIGTLPAALGPFRQMHLAAGAQLGGAAVGVQPNGQILFKYGVAVNQWLSLDLVQYMSGS